MNKEAIILVILAIVFALASIGILKENERLSDEIKRLSQNNEVLLSQQKQYKLNDSIRVSQIKALTVKANEAEKYVGELNSEIKKLRDSKKSKVEYVTETIKTDTFLLPSKRDTIYVGADTCFGYNDGFLSFLQCGDKAYIESTDTIKQVISKHYKNRFLWWKWNSDGINQDIWCTNPHSNIKFEKFVKYE